jgi:hypothetical protein
MKSDSTLTGSTTNEITITGLTTPDAAYASASLIVSLVVSSNEMNANVLQNNIVLVPVNLISATVSSSSST